jgi:dipeptidyl-peptidase-3
MRNRQLVVHWILANRPRALASEQRDGKSFLRVLDASEFRDACGALLAEVQRLKSTGDYDGAHALVEAYGTRFDPALRDEILRRYATLDVPAYVGFLFPRLVPVRDAAGTVVDARVEYPRSIEEQMLEWSGRLKP